MHKPDDERAVKVVPIPEDIYDQISEHADKKGLSIMGVTCRALLDYIDTYIEKPVRKNAQKTQNNA